MNSNQPTKSNSISELLRSLEDVGSRGDLERWVRRELRRVVPHAMFLCTLGKLFGLGSVATHRIGVDFPFNLVEDLKNGAGALENPLMSRWFKSGKTNYIDVAGLNNYASLHDWRETMMSYGVRGMVIYGHLDHGTKRFAAFELANPLGGSSIETASILNALSRSLSNAAWRVIASGASRTSRDLICQPTLGLTATELHIIELLAQGFSNKEIARRRGVSDSTIKTQVQRTGAKLGANRRAEIVAIALPMLTPLPAQTVIDYNDV